jgi:predicted amidohydrolase
VKVAAYQAPYLPFGSLDAVGLIGEQMAVCRAEGVGLLCCPEAVVGGLAHESAGQSPAEVALHVAGGELASTLAPLLAASADVALVVGFTERGDDGNLFSSAAVIAGGQVVTVARKAYPGYRTVIEPGGAPAPVDLGPWRFGVLICNDIWYLEPSRLLASSGAAVLLVPSNSGHLGDEEMARRLRARGDNLPVARAVENTASVVVADIAGHQGDRFALGCSSIVDPDGVVLARSRPDGAELLIAEVEGQRRPHDPRGWDGGTNPAVAEAFVGLWNAGPT